MNIVAEVQAATSFVNDLVDRLGVSEDPSSCFEELQQLPKLLNKIGKILPAPAAPEMTDDLRQIIDAYRRCLTSLLEHCQVLADKLQYQRTDLYRNLLRVQSIQAWDRAALRSYAGGR